MDFSKASLQKNIIQDTFYVDDSVSNQKNPENHRHNCDIGEGDEQDSINLKYKQLDPHHMINRHDINPVLNVDNSSHENDLSGLEKSIQYNFEDKTVKLQNSNSKTGQSTTLEIELQKSLSSSSNLYGKKNISNQLSDNNILISNDKPNKNIDHLIEDKNEQNQIDVEDEEETIEKIAEMIETSSKDPKNTIQSKKRLQVLMRRNYSEQDNACNDVNLYSSPEKVNDITYNSRKHINNLPNVSSANAKKNEITDDNISNNSRFEEIEDKLEEMFAGIEDEKLENVTTDHRNITKRNCEEDKNHTTIFVDDVSRSLPTKAAKKSTHATISNIEISSPVLNQNNKTIQNSTKEYLKTIHTSINMKISNEEENEVNCNKNIIKIKDKIVTAQPINCELNKDAKKRTKYVRKSKLKNNRRKCSEFKNENKKIIKNCKIKKNMSKSDTSTKSTNQQKIKTNPSSENEIEERQLQIKDNETKHRSPFILVKNNGSITVINTVTADDPNEKWARTKKTSNYAYERKTVKGCHSSTLSNRYDADTADSSWICVLCKIGPHKKRLGDLFGPYIISSDCEEYRSVKEFTEKKQMQHGTDIPLSNFANNLIKYIDEKAAPDIQQISTFKEEPSPINFTFGMSRISDVCYEIWIHEECAIWAPNIFVVGSRLAGLEDVTWNSIRYECVYCLKPGALLCCLQRDCKATSHVPCAREFNWLLDESKFWTYCGKHVLK